MRSCSPATMTSRSDDGNRPVASDPSARCSRTATGRKIRSTAWSITSSRSAAGSSLASSGTITSSPPDSQVEKSSWNETSKPALANCSVRAPRPTTDSRHCQATRLARGPTGISTPFGTPVDPDVKSVYARWSSPRSGITSSGGPAASSSAAAPESIRTVRGLAPSGGIDLHSVSTSAAVRLSDTMNGQPAIATIDASRSGGSVGSSGTQQAFAMRTPRIAAWSSGERGRQIATGMFLATPATRNRVAICSACACNSR